MPEVGRKAAHLLIDAVTAYDPGADEQTNEATMNLALIALEETGAVDIQVADDGSDGVAVSVDVSNVVGPSISALHWLALRVSVLSGRSVEEVLHDLREHIDDES